MKTLKTIIFASAALLAAAACTKEANPKEESVPSAPGTIEVNVTALIGDLAPSEGTKATMDPVIRLTWADEGDVVYAYDATQKIGDLTVTPASDGLSAKLSGTLSEVAAGTTKITLVYCNTATEAPEITSGNITFDLSTQNKAANPFVVYATLDYTAGQTSITDKIVPFNFATSLMRVTVTGLTKNKSITEATVSGVNTKCELAVSATGEPTVEGITPGNISRTTGFTSSDGRAVFNVSVAAEATTNTNRKLTIKQGDLIYGSDLMSKVITAGSSIISVYALTEQTGSRGKIKGQDYVYVAGKKWATQNLAISSSGKGAWLSAKVPGNSTESVVIGDYFQWGAYPGYVTVNGDDKGLLIYESFTNDGSSGSFSFKSPEEGKTYQFNTSTSGTSVGISPYYSSSSYTKYADADISYRPNLDLSDDVAHTLWGESWRMPGIDEFDALRGATKWTWDDTDKGYYVTKSGEDLSADKSNALLFFPAAGHGKEGGLNDAGRGYYWLSTRSIFVLDYVYSFSSYNDVGSGRNRHYGYSVRPLSD